MMGRFRQLAPWRVPTILLGVILTLARTSDYKAMDRLIVHHTCVMGAFGIRAILPLVRKRVRQRFNAEKFD
jgi:hypothetical protein